MDPAPTSTDVNTFIVDLDGVVQKPTTDFTISGATLTLGTGASLAQVLTVRNIGVSRDILTDSPSITGDLSVGDDLTVTDDASVGGDLTVTDDASVGGDLTVTGDLSVGGDLTVTGAIGDLGDQLVRASGSDTDRSLADRFGEVINVKDLGAVGDGDTDDTVAIQAALSAGLSVFFPDGTYKVTSTLTMYENSMIDFGNALLDFSTASDGDVMFTITGSAGTEYALVSNASMGELTVTVASGVGLNFSIGDVVKIGSDTIYDPGNTDRMIGEIAVVESISSDTLTIAVPLEASYTTASSAFVQKLTMVENIHIKNGRIKADTVALGHTGDAAVGNQKRGFSISFGRNIRIENVTIDEFDRTAIFLGDCLETTVSSCTIRESQAYDDGYGVASYNTTQNLLVLNNHFYNCRHAFTTVSGSTNHGFSRHVIVQGNSVVVSNQLDMSGSGEYTTANPGPGEGLYYPSSGDALDTHAGSEDIHFIDNVIKGAGGHSINFECARGSIVGNKIYGSGDDAIRYRNETAVAGYMFIANNVIDGNLVKTTNPYKNDPGADEFYSVGGIDCFQGTYGSTDTDGLFESIIITGNMITNCTGIGLRVRAVDLVDSKHSGIIVSNNSVLNCTEGKGIDLDDLQHFSVTGNVVGSVHGYGIKLHDCDYGTVSGNFVQLQEGAATDATAIYADYCTFTTFQGNTVRTAASDAAKVGLKIASNCASVLAQGNLATGFATSNYDFNAASLVDGGTGGSGDAGAGKQYVELEIHGTTYKLLYRA